MANLLKVKTFMSPNFIFRFWSKVLQTLLRKGMEGRDDHQNQWRITKRGSGSRKKETLQHIMYEEKSRCPNRTMKGLITDCRFMMKQSLLKVMGAAPGMKNLSFASG